MDKEITISPAADVFQQSWFRDLFGNVDMPARKVRPSRYSITGYAPTKKGTRAQDTESSLEQDFLTLLEFDDRVEAYLAQPFTIHWLDAAGKNRRYTPDVIVKYTRKAERESPTLRTTVFEVKPRAVIKEDWPDLKPKFRAGISWANGFGCRFRLVTDKEIRTPYLKNARFLLDYRSSNLPESAGLTAQRKLLIAQALLSLQVTTPKELLNTMADDLALQGALLPWVWNMVQTQMIGVDLAKPLTMSSEIWATDEVAQLVAEG